MEDQAIIAGPLLLRDSIKEREFEPAIPIFGLRMIMRPLDVTATGICSFDLLSTRVLLYFTLVLSSVRHWYLKVRHDHFPTVLTTCTVHKDPNISPFTGITADGKTV